MALLALLSTVAVAATPPCPPASRPGWDRSGSDCDDAHGLERWIRSRMLSVHPCRKMPVLWPAASQAQGRTMLKASWLFWHEWCKPSEIIVTKLVGAKFASASVLTRFPLSFTFKCSFECIQTYYTQSFHFVFMSACAHEAAVFAFSLTRQM